MDFFSRTKKRSPCFSCASWQDQKMDSLKIIIIIIYFWKFNFIYLFLSRSPCFGFARQWLYFSSSESSFLSSPCHIFLLITLLHFSKSIIYFIFWIFFLGLASLKWNKVTSRKMMARGWKGKDSLGEKAFGVIVIAIITTIFTTKNINK